MKPEDLKSAFKWPERQVVIADRVWYVPSYYQEYQKFTFPGWDHPDFFGNSNPVHVEYCSGNGAWIAEKAKRNPHINWIAVEKKFPRVRKIWAKVKNEGLNNLLIVSGHAQVVTAHYFPQGSIQAAYVNFPDPWPKARHAKNRLIAPLFVEEVARALEPQGKFTLVTDDQDYSKIMIDVVSQNSRFGSVFPAPFFVTDLPEYGKSYFEELWREKQRVIHYHQFSLHK